MGKHPGPEVSDVFYNNILQNKQFLEDEMLEPLYNSNEELNKALQNCEIEKATWSFEIPCCYPSFTISYRQCGGKQLFVTGSSNSIELPRDKLAFNCVKTI